MMTSRNHTAIEVCLEQSGDNHDLIVSLMEGVMWRNDVILGGVIKAGSYDQRHAGRDYRLKLNHDVSYRGAVDLKSDLAVSDAGVQQLLEKVRREGVVSPGLHLVRVTQGGVETWCVYYLKNTLIAHKKMDGMFYYDVVDIDCQNRIGKGAYGSVYMVSGAIKPRFFNTNDFCFSPGNTKRVLKVSSFDKCDDEFDKRLRRFRKEAQLLKRSAHSRARDHHEKISSDEVHGYISMRRYDGNVLEDILKYDHALLKLGKAQQRLRESYDRLVSKAGCHYPMLETDYKDNLDKFSKAFHSARTLAAKLKPEYAKEMSVLDRIELSIRLLREFCGELIAHQIIHADIKPVNLFMQSSKYYREPKPRFIDFGFARDDNDYDPGLLGTPLYLSPESVNGSLTRSSDVYALVRVIGEVWRDKELTANERKFVSIPQFFRMRKDQDDIAYDLFDGIPVQKELKDSIAQAIKGGTLRSARMRYDAYKLIELFEAIRLQYYLRNTDESLSEKLTEAHKLAIQILQVCSGKIQFDIDAFISLVEGQLAGLSDDPEVLEIYTHTLDVDVMRSCGTRQQIIEAMHHVKAQYESALAVTQSFLQSMTTAAMESGDPCYIKFANYQNEWLSGFLREVNCFDAVCLAVDKLNEKAQKINAAKSYYENLLHKNNNNRVTNGR